MLEYQELIDKVRDFRYLNVRESQIGKFNRLLQKEGNITWSSIPPNPPKTGSSAGLASVPSQLGRSAGRAGSHFQVDNINPLSWEGVQVGAGDHSQAGSINPPARKECMQCSHSF